MPLVGTVRRKANTRARVQRTVPPEVRSVPRKEAREDQQASQKEKKLKS